MLDKNRPIGALVKTTLVDFPGRVASALFLHGCNLRCPYCQNKDLVTGSFADYEPVSFTQVISHLEKRQDVISGFTVSGGEPLMSPFLSDLILHAKKLKYAVKIDTNGMFPAKLRTLLETPETQPDFIALDVKTSPERYGELFAHKPEESAAKKAAEHIIESIKIISELSAFKREFRTVLVPGLVGEKEIRAVARLLPADASWQFARFSNKNCLNSDWSLLEPYDEKQTFTLMETAQSLIKNSHLR